MKKRITRTACASIISGLVLATGLAAAITAEQAARLGADLTPVGAIRAGNTAGTIPAWDGGITTPPPGYSPGMHHPDPYADDQPLYVVTAANQAQYANILTDGHKALLDAYPETYRIPVYPSRRSASMPRRIYDATKQIALTAQVTGNGAGITGAVIGIPFPIPANGQEVIWNHLARYRGDSAIRHIAQAAPQRNGNYTLVEFEDEFLFNYTLPGMTEDRLENVLAFFKQTVLAPARLAGSILIVHETLDQIQEPRRAWTYNVGQRRVRRAPNVAYDNPGTAADGMRTSDQFDMFSGAIDRYNWTLVGRREMLVPYNSYKLHSDSISVDDVIRPLHINQDLTRYELHRVWVVDAILREGTRHIYATRRFYIDEDSWQIVAIDQYDNRGELWRVSEGHGINYYDVPVYWTTLEVHTDLQAGRYLAIGMDNENDMYEFGIERSPADYTPSSLRRSGRR